MPLKHFTETFLVVVLGAVTALTGLLVATLPNLPEGALPCAVLFVLTIIYPLSLYSLFQRRRADNFFRNLHWFPALMVLGWLLLQGAALGSTVDTDFFAFYTWSWALGPVLLGFIFLVAFCLKVIRRRVPRLTFLALILIPFSAGALVSAQGGHWEDELATALWSGSFWEMDGNGLLASLTGSGRSAETANLEPSDDPHEEDWRERLRMQRNREERIAERMEHRSSSSEDAMMEHQSSSSSSTSVAMMSVSSKPTSLPSAGFDWNVILLTMAGVYCASVHRKTSQRNLAI